MSIAEVDLEERGRHMPQMPRVYLNGTLILPLVDDEWKPVKNMWVLPGRQVLTTEELRDLARARDWVFLLLN